MLLYRLSLSYLWTQHKTNEWILQKLEFERELLGRVQSLKLGYYGHTTRKYERLEKELIQGYATEVVVDNADVGRTTSSSGQG